jgi:hypothetical protein
MSSTSFGVHASRKKEVKSNNDGAFALMQRFSKAKVNFLKISAIGLQEIGS